MGCRQAWTQTQKQTQTQAQMQRSVGDEAEAAEEKAAGVSVLCGARREMEDVVAVFDN